MPILSPSGTSTVLAKPRRPTREGHDGLDLLDEQDGSDAFDVHGLDLLRIDWVATPRIRRDRVRALAARCMKILLDNTVVSIRLRECAKWHKSSQGDFL